LGFSEDIAGQTWSGVCSSGLASVETPTTMPHPAIDAASLGPTAAPIPPRVAWRLVAVLVIATWIIVGGLGFGLAAQVIAQTFPSDLEYGALALDLVFAVCIGLIVLGVARVQNANGVFSSMPVMNRRVYDSRAHTRLTACDAVKAIF
jgi:hypothetical protein